MRPRPTSPACSRASRSGPSSKPASRRPVPTCMSRASWVGCSMPRNFERWLVAEALELLVDGRVGSAAWSCRPGSTRFAFEETSRDFLVVDHRNANERRSVRTLSGGETFQASLALALALADQLADLAADGAARLESIFLDEGFGALDPDTLETVAGTIENLGAGDRMVGVVTHVRELADRMPVQYRVTQGSAHRDGRAGHEAAMRFRVDPWSVEYGASVESDLVAERGRGEHRGRAARRRSGRPIAGRPDARQPAMVLFVDGVRRVDARVWIEDPNGDAEPGICASFGAGVARCGAGLPAEVIHPSSVGACSARRRTRSTSRRRTAATPRTSPAAPTPEALWIALQERMARREVEAAEAARRECPDPGRRARRGRRSAQRPSAHRRRHRRDQDPRRRVPPARACTGSSAGSSPGPHAGVHDRRPLVPLLLVPAPPRRRRRAVGRRGAGRVLDGHRRRRARSRSRTPSA